MAAAPIGPEAVGIGLRAPHYRELAEHPVALGFIEVHAENFFGAGGAHRAWLERLRREHSLSLHGVGLSLGSADPLDRGHLERLRELIARFEPALVSEHLSWSSFGGVHANDLLPLPCTREAVDHVVSRVNQAQQFLGRRILVENVTAYAAPSGDMPEWEFVAAVARRAGCGVLLDVNNLWINAVNHGFDPLEYLRGIDSDSVAEIHLAGHERVDGLLVDTHAAPVADEVWTLYAEALERFGPRPTLIEWDASLPPLGTLLEERRRAESVMARARPPAAVAA